ncbi:hypothetical protein Rsub_03183 [Raphidocelis subcapitata]|uniref:F-box domain-containing protein n=1 Tax=Raphidocelis subcapitata TaxID=307507 RepID=A0A2V0NSJ9_9CHLO|nr:hypothetical protein Rsub_03183 [Raphidocelis subcapitata]|eukprot:GBF90611.1 hypothetical protein Rsub_03183 [Raphidocelis subcapitata]
MEPHGAWARCFGCFGCGTPDLESRLEDLNCRSGYVTASSWDSVPQDVLLAVGPYLSAAARRSCRLACRNWRLTFSADVPELRLPLAFASSPAAAGALRRVAGGFPSLARLQLSHADGWCDPVQARMNLEPMVRLDSRAVCLDALAAALPALPSLSVQDATFTRDPWPLGPELRKLPGLKDLSVEWDTALWAPGQTMHEWEALSGVFALTALSRLRLRKGARLFLGEAPLGAAALAAAAPMRGLRCLELSALRLAGDAPLAALGLLTGLTRLALGGQLAVGLGGLAAALAQLTGLEELELGQLAASNEDLAAAVAAHAEGKAARRAAGRGGGAARGRGGRGGGGRSGGGGAADAGAGGGGADDWSRALSPLSRLRRLCLQSDLAFLGGCAALRSMRALTHVSLQGGAKFLEFGAASRDTLPASWLALRPASPAPDDDGGGEDGDGGGGGGGVVPGWPALRRLQIDGLQLADGLVDAVARLCGLRTLVLSGPCLLAHQPQHRALAPALAAQLQAQLRMAGAAAGGAAAGAAAGDGGGAAAGLLQLPPGDRDLLTRLSPLTALERFELHTQPQTPHALHASNFALSHLLICWTALTSLHFDMRARSGAPPIGALAFAARLRDLSINMLEAGALAGAAPAAPAAAAAAAAPASAATAPGGGGGADGGGGEEPPGPVEWRALPAGLQSLSLSGLQIGPRDLAAMAEASAGIRHLRLLFTGARDHHAYHIARGWPGLETLIIKEPAGSGGLNGSGLSAIGGRLAALRALAVTVQPRADAAPLGALSALERLVLDGRANAEVVGWAGLCRLGRLRSITLPLLQMHRDGTFAALQAALRDCAISNAGAALNVQFGCHWFAHFGEAERDWWRQPAAPWAWHPFLLIRV